jgi:rhamnulokinase
MSRRFLALDLGAESGRAMLASLDLQKLELAELHRWPNTPVRLPDGLYWDTLRLFHEISEGIRAAGKAVAHLDGIALDAWGVDFGLLGADGGLLANPRHYRDSRTDALPEAVFAIIPKHEVFAATGIQVMQINSLYQLFSIQRKSPALLGAAAKLLFMPDLLNYFLTGVECSERTIASTSQFYNPVTGQFATDLLRRLGITPSFLAELVDPGTQLGAILPHVADHCGLHSSPKVFTTGCHDTASAVAAVPAKENSQWCYISSGTWSLMGVELDAPVINEACQNANFTNEVGVDRRIRLLKNIAGLWLLQECRRAWAKEGQEYSYDELMQQADAAGHIDSVIDPDAFASPGRHPERICDHCRRTGQRVPKDAGETTRVILYSLAVRYKDVLETLETLTGRSIEVIHIVGGGSRNRLLNQLAADVTKRRVVAGPTEATAAGNALTQAMGTGDVSSLEELRTIIRHSFGVEEFRPRG